MISKISHKKNRQCYFCKERAVWQDVGGRVYSMTCEEHKDKLLNARKRLRIDEELFNIKQSLQCR